MRYDLTNPVARDVERRLAGAIDDAILQGARRFIRGGALGVDQMAVRIVISRKKSVSQ